MGCIAWHLHRFIAHHDIRKASMALSDSIGLAAFSVSMKGSPGPDQRQKIVR